MTRDLRKYARDTNLRLLIGFILLLFIVGGGLIYAFYGPQSVVFGFLCLLAGLAPLVLIGLLLWGLEWIVKRANEE
jgi:Na+/proline symporter